MIPPLNLTGIGETPIQALIRRQTRSPVHFFRLSSYIGLHNRLVGYSSVKIKGTKVHH